MSLQGITLFVVICGAIGSIGNFILQTTWYHKSKHTWKEEEGRVSGNAQRRYNQLLIDDKISYSAWSIIQALIKKSSPLSQKELEIALDSSHTELINHVTRLLELEYIEAVGVDSSGGIYYLTDKKD
jgi:hypothetical protein